jgi:hypothetical protein
VVIDEESMEREEGGKKSIDRKIKREKMYILSFILRSHL